MDDRNQKYIRLNEFNQIIIFPDTIQHDEFRNFDPVSAGFCYVDGDKITCFGESISLGIESDVEDSNHATKQIFGFDAMLKHRIK